MEYDRFKSTTVGADYLEALNKDKFLLPIDGYLDYMMLITKLKEECKDNSIWELKFDLEIQATRRIIKKINQLK